MFRQYKERQILTSETENVGGDQKVELLYVIEINLLSVKYRLLCL